jgi:hypothetical protein
MERKFSLTIIKGGIMPLTVILMRIDYKDHVTQEVTQVRFTNAPFDVEYMDLTWQAAGDLLSIGRHETNYEIVTEGVEIKLSGINSSYRSVIDRHGFRFAPVDIFLATLEEDSNQVTAASYYHRGFALSPLTELDEASGTITVVFETQSAFKSLERNSHLMTTSIAHHQSLHPADRFFEYVADAGLGEETWKDG